MAAKLLSSDDLGKLVLRLTTGGLMLLHGLHKVLHPDSLDFIRKLLVSIDLPPLLAYGVYLGEVVGGLMIILGIYSRMGGALVFGNMVFALTLAHRDELWTLSSTGGWAVELQAFFLFSALAILLLGSGRIAIKPD